MQKTTVKTMIDTLDSHTVFYCKKICFPPHVIGLNSFFYFSLISSIVLQFPVALL